MSGKTGEKSRTCAHEAAACLYNGSVMHARMKPKAHRFRYRVFSLLIDLDRLEEADRLSRFFSVNRPNLVSFRESDHGERDGSSLRAHIDTVLKAGGYPPAKRVLLWCNPRVFGYVFNPLSVYFCEDETGQVSTLVYQVHNTFGDSHSYVLSAENGHNSGDTIRHEATKRFHVSPFLDLGLRYRFRVEPPRETLKIHILETDAEGPVLVASFKGTAETLNGWKLFQFLLQTAGLTWKITAGIHFEALRLWLKGIRVRKRPDPPEAVSYPQRNGSLQPGE